MPSNCTPGRAPEDSYEGLGRYRMEGKVFFEVTLPAIKMVKP
jgi:hypothetical protein